MRDANLGYKMSTELRYCKKCNENTIQDKCRGVVPGLSDAFTRTFFGVFTLGFSELASDTYYTCTKCDNLTVK